MSQNLKLGLAIFFGLIALICVLLTAGGNPLPAVSPLPTATDVSSQPSPTASFDPTKMPSAKPTTSAKPKPVALNYWPNGLVAEDVTNTIANNRNCTFDMCVFIKLTAVSTCRTITLDGDIYDINDEYFDSFSSDYSGLKKGQSKIVELGDDIVDDSEDYVELADSTCYK